MMWPKTFNELINHHSYCADNAEEIISEENQSKHVAMNVNKDRVKQIKVDGDILKRTETFDIRADYLLMNLKKKTAYIIELKGCNIKHAFEQVENTDLRLKSVLKKFKVNWRVIYNSRTLNVRSNRITKYLMNHPQLRIKNHMMKEEI